MSNPNPADTPRTHAPQGRSTNWALWLGVLAVVLILAWPTLSNAFRPVREDKIPWRTDLAAALAEAKATGKPLLVDFTASWCPPCQAMKRDTWPDPRVHEAVVAKAVPVLIDVDAQPDVARRFAIEAMPTIMLVNAEGQVQRSAVGYRDAEGILSLLP